MQDHVVFICKQEADCNMQRSPFVLKKVHTYKLDDIEEMLQNVLLVLDKVNGAVKRTRYKT
jgi:hypothetical protein